MGLQILIIYTIKYRNIAIIVIIAAIYSFFIKRSNDSKIDRHFRFSGVRDLGKSFKLIYIC